MKPWLPYFLYRVKPGLAGVRNVQPHGCGGGEGEKQSAASHLVSHGNARWFNLSTYVGLWV